MALINRVFVFEDEDVTRSLLCDLCTELGCEAHGYASPSQSPMYVKGAFRWDRAEGCNDIVIADVNMPEVNGIDFLWGSRLSGHQLDHVALISGYFTAATEAKAKELGFAVFRKPFPIGTIREWVRSRMIKAPTKPG